MKIEIVDLKKEFNKVLVLENVNLELTSGKIYGLIGRNGSGKSVLLKMICGFYKPTSGKILFDGVDIIKKKTYPPSTRALIENPSFLSDLSGYENLKMLAKIQNKIGKEEIEESLKNVNLFEDKDKLYGKYSLGMKQKLGIAQAIMEKPKVIILDEPFNGIEGKTVEKIKKLLIKMKKDGCLILLSSHIKDDLLDLADEFYEFDNMTVEKISRSKLMK